MTPFKEIDFLIQNLVSMIISYFLDMIGFSLLDEERLAWEEARDV